MSLLTSNLKYKKQKYSVNEIKIKAVNLVLKKVISKPSKLGQVKIKEFKKPELVPSNSKILKPFNWSLIAFAII